MKKPTAKIIKRLEDYQEMIDVRNTRIDTILVEIRKSKVSREDQAQDIVAFAAELTQLDTEIRVSVSAMGNIKRALRDMGVEI
tara:strand:- start:4207 stop:4455 length:249 start_codon:yes stop_codon:yes gene_type:complete